MNELLKALTEFLQEATVYLAQRNNPTAQEQRAADRQEPTQYNPTATEAQEIAAAAEAIDAPKAKRTRRTKEQVRLAAEVDGIAPAPAAPAATQAPTITEAESAKQVMEVAGLLVKRFNAPHSSNTPDGKGGLMPDGFFIAKEILRGQFKVERIAQLDHVGRVNFMAVVRARISEADKATPPALATTAGVADI